MLPLDREERQREGGDNVPNVLRLRARKSKATASIEYCQYRFPASSHPRGARERTLMSLCSPPAMTMPRSASAPISAGGGIPSGTYRAVMPFAAPSAEVATVLKPSLAACTVDTSELAQSAEDSRRATPWEHTASFSARRYVPRHGTLPPPRGAS